MTFVCDHFLQLLNLNTFPVDIDEKFLDNFIDLYLPIGRNSLRKIEFYCCKIQTSEVSLALYMQLLRKIGKHEGVAIFESLNFLTEREFILINGSATLQQSLFGLITDMESVEVKHSFKFDLSAKIHQILSSDNTAINVRLSVETLSIVHIQNLIKQEPSSNLLLCNLTESLLESDYILILDSISKVIIKFLPNLTQSFFERLVQKAKNSKRIGLTFARLIAQILTLSNFGTIKMISSGFSDKYSKALILSQLIEYNRNSLKFSELELFQLLIESADNRVNFIIPVLVRSNDFLLNQQDIVAFLKLLISNLSNPKFCSEKNIELFLNFLSEHFENMELFSLTVDHLKDRIFKSPIILSYFLNLKKPTFKEILNGTNLFDILSNAVKKLYKTDLNLLNDSIDNNWEETDSTLEILQFCDPNILDCDVNKLVQYIFKIAFSDCNQFVRSSAQKCLKQMYLHNKNFPTFTNDQINMFELIKKELKNEEELCEKSNSMHRILKQEIRSEIDDIIISMQHSCGINDCVSKECY